MMGTVAPRGLHSVGCMVSSVKPLSAEMEKDSEEALCHIHVCIGIRLIVAKVFALH